MAKHFAAAINQTGKKKDWQSRKKWLLHFEQFFSPHPWVYTPNVQRPSCSSFYLKHLHFAAVRQHAWILELCWPESDAAVGVEGPKSEAAPWKRERAGQKKGTHLPGRVQRRWSGGSEPGTAAAPPSAPAPRSNRPLSPRRRSSWHKPGSTWWQKRGICFCFSCAKSWFGSCLSIKAIFRKFKNVQLWFVDVSVEWWKHINGNFTFVCWLSRMMDIFFSLICSKKNETKKQNIP